MAHKFFFAKDWIKGGRIYSEIYTTVCLGYTFTVGKGIEKKDRDFSIFYVTNDGQQDHYELLDVYLTAGDTLEEIQKGVLATLKREMKRVITKGLTTRVKSGMLTIEQIERWVKDYSLECFSRCGFNNLYHLEE